MLYQVWLPREKTDKDRTGCFLGFLSLCSDIQNLPLKDIWDELRRLQLVQAELTPNHFIYFDYSYDGYPPSLRGSIGTRNGDWYALLHPLKPILDGKDIEAAAVNPFLKSSIFTVNDWSTTTTLTWDDLRYFRNDRNR